MINQNGYGPTQYCIKCNKPLEKPRVGKNIGKGVCLKCQKIRQSERNREYRLKTYGLNK